MGSSEHLPMMANSGARALPARAHRREGVRGHTTRNCSAATHSQETSDAQLRAKAEPDGRHVTGIGITRSGDACAWYASACSSPPANRVQHGYANAADGVEASEHPPQMGSSE